MWPSNFWALVIFLLCQIRPQALFSCTFTPQSTQQHSMANRLEHVRSNMMHGDGGLEEKVEGNVLTQPMEAIIVVGQQALFSLTTT